MELYFEEKKCPSKGTIIRTVCLILALLNSVLAIFDKSPLPINDEEVVQIVSFIFTAGSAMTAWWKNNSFTEKAIEADEYLNS